MPRPAASSFAARIALTSAWAPVSLECQNLAVAGGLADPGRDLLLDGGVERGGAVPGCSPSSRRGDDRAAERVTGVLGEQAGVARDPRLVADGLGDRSQIADRDPLVRSRWRTHSELAERQHVRDNLGDDRLVGLLELVEQRAYVLAGVSRSAACRRSFFREVGDDSLGSGHRRRCSRTLPPQIAGRPRSARREGRCGLCCWGAGKAQCTGGGNASFIASLCPATIRPRVTTAPRTLTT